jgi:hypothetical protein
LEVEEFPFNYFSSCDLDGLHLVSLSANPFISRAFLAILLAALFG